MGARPGRFPYATATPPATRRPIIGNRQQLVAISHITGGSYNTRYHVVPQRISPPSPVARSSTQQVVFQEISEDSREILRGCVGVITESVSELKGLIDDGPPWQFSTDVVAEFRLYPFPDRLVDTVSTVETG